MHGLFSSVLLAGLVATVPGAAGAVPSADSSGARVQSVCTAAWKGADFSARAAALESERAAARLNAHPGAPYTELQREGIGAGLGAADNAAWYVRLGTPLNAPWQRQAIRSALDATSRQLTARRRLLALEAAGNAVGAWLELAAVEARLGVKESQSSRLGEALTLQKKRLELGEISGAEVTQLELERLRLLTTVTQLRAERVASVQVLERLAGPAAPRPRPGDLEGLQALMSPVDAASASGLEEAIETSPALTAAVLGTERVRLESERDRRTVWGVPEAEVSWERIPTIQGVDGFDAVGVRVRLPLPIGGLGKRSAADARARQHVAEAEEERARRELAAAIRSAAERATSSARSLEALVAVERDLARIEHSVTERYRLGAVSYLEYIDGLQRLDGVRSLAIDVRLDRLRARLDLAVLTGDLSWFPLPDPELEMIP